MAYLFCSHISLPVQTTPLYGSRLLSRDSLIVLRPLPVQTTPQYVNLFVSHDGCPAPVACADHAPVRELVSFIRHLHLPHLQHQPSEDLQPPAILLLFRPPCSPELWLHMLPGKHGTAGWVGKGKKRLNDKSVRRACRVGLVHICSLESGLGPEHGCTCHLLSCRGRAEQGEGQGELTKASGLYQARGQQQGSARQVLSHGRCYNSASQLAALPHPLAQTPSCVSLACQPTDFAFPQRLLLPTCPLLLHNLTKPSPIRLWPQNSYPCEPSDLTAAPAIFVLPVVNAATVDESCLDASAVYIRYGWVTSGCV